jgi:hypothetical protein
MNNLSNIKDKKLLDQTNELRKKERQTTAKLLEYIQEIQRRRLFCDLGYTSLFEYLTKHLFYSESQASRRIAAARLVTENESAKKKIEEGSLSLTTASDLSRYFSREKVGSEKQDELIEKAKGMSKRECENLILEDQNEEVLLPRESTQKINREVTRLHINASEKTMEKVERVKELYGSLDYDQLLSLLCDVAIKEKEDVLLRPAKKEKKMKGRNISIQVKRKVYQRAQGQCEGHDDKKGKRCSSRGKLEFDHIRPVALGGNGEFENIRLLCRNHNIRAAIKVLGQEKMALFTSPGK